MEIGILGAGSWAIALAKLLHYNNHKLTMWEFDPVVAKKLAKEREAKDKLPGIILPDDILVTNSLEEIFKNSEYIVIAVPAQTVRSTMKAIKNTISYELIEKIKGWILVSKGIETGSLKLLTDVITEEIEIVNYSRLLVLSGPSHAEEVARNIPTTVVVASESTQLAEIIQREFSTPFFRIYTNNDVRGVELCGSVKNVIAIASGISDGLGFGDNTKGALLTRGIVEIARLGKKMGAKETTFYGLAGIGDLITTCISKHSRNRYFGEKIASGMKPEEIQKSMTMVAEGVPTTKAVYELAKKYEIDMPITREVYNAIYKAKDPLKAVNDLMKRQFKPEVY